MNRSHTENPENTLTCGTCGRHLPLTAKFCGFDGTAINSSTSTQKPGAKKVCPKCQRHFPAYATFCPEDANRLQDQTEDISLPEQAVEAPIASPASFTTTLEEIKITSSPERDFLDDSLPLAQTDISGQIIANKYRIDELLGRGGMAEVYKATHISIDKAVVVKVILGDLSTKERSLKRFERECRVTAKIDHPNVVSVYDNGILDGRRPYLVMEFIKGESLRDLLRRSQSVSFAMAARILIQVCSGLQEAHKLGIVHRDLKPENIMLRESQDRPDWVKVVDFGIASLREGGEKLTKTGVAIGTLDYLSPELLRDEPIDQRSDLYSLGIILVEMLTGQCPFSADSPYAIVTKHLYSAPNLPSNLCPDLEPGCPADLLVLKALEKDPMNRFQSALELREALQSALDQAG